MAGLSWPKINDNGDLFLMAALFLAVVFLLVLISRIVVQAVIRRQIEQEVAERKQAEEGLRQKEALFRLLADNATDVIWTLGHRREFTYVSPSVERLRGFTPDEAMRQSLAETFMPMSLRVIEPALQRIYEAEEAGVQYPYTDRYELQQPCKTGAIVWAELIINVMHDDNGKFMGVLGVTRDITDQKRAEQNIHRTNFELQQRVEELARLNDITQTLVSNLDFETALNTITRELCLLFNADTCGVVMLNAGRTHYTVVAEYTQTNTPSTVGMVFALQDNPLSARIIATKKPALFTAKDITPIDTGREDVLNQRRVQCMLVVPLLARAEVIGTIGIDTTTPGRVFSPQEVELAQTVAGQLAGVIANARLFQQERRQRQMAESLQEVATVLNSSLDLPTVLQKIMQQFGRVINHDGVAIFLLVDDDLVLTASEKVSDIYLGIRIPVTSNSPGAQVFRTNRSMLIDDVRVHPDWEVWADNPNPPVLCWMGAPLSVEDKVIGTLNADSFTPFAYSKDDQRALETFANHAATAIRNAQQVKLIEDTLFETQLLYRVGSILAKTPDIQRGIEKALGEFLHVLSVDQGGIALFEPGQSSGRLFALYRHGRPQPIGDPINLNSVGHRHVIETGQPLAIYDALNDPRLQETRDLTANHQIKSMLFIPLISRGQVIGVMGADATANYRVFTEHEKGLAQAVADQIATTIENARLFEQEQEQRRMAESLRQVATSLTSSLDLRVVLQKILEQLAYVVRYDGAGILLQQGGQLVLSAGTDHAGDFIGTAISMDTDDPAVRVVKSKTAMFIPDVHRDPAWKIWPGGESIRGWMGSPLITGQGVIGTLTVDSERVGAYNEKSVQLLQTFANQAAVAIENANLFAQLQAAKEAAEAASHAKSFFLASVSHEVRTPLNGILGFAQILKMDPIITARQREGLDVIEQSGHHLLTLINDILDLAKIEAGRLDLHYANFNLIKFLNGVCKIIQIRTEFKSIYFQCIPNILDNTAGMPHDLPQVVHGDEIRLRQVLINILGNAVKFTDIGGVIFRVNRLDAGLNPAECALRFEIEDTGSGIAAEDQDAIFEPFQQVGHEARKSEGTGLGLNICFNLVQLMGGQLQVNSTVGVGSRFWFDLPLPEVVDTAALLAPPEALPIVGIKGRAPKILLVAKTYENRKVLVGLLSPLGCEIIETTDGVAGLTQAIQHVPDAIITDVSLPKMSGLEMVASLRQHPLLKDVVIIATSSSLQSTDPQQSLAAGCDTFIPKPIKADQLYAELQKLLGLEWIYADAGAQNPSSTPPALIPPEPPALSKLIDLARIGDVRQIRRYVADLEQRDARLKPFTDQVNVLAKGFQLERLRSFLASF